MIKAIINGVKQKRIEYEMRQVKKQFMHYYLAARKRELKRGV